MQEEEEKAIPHPGIVPTDGLRAPDDWVDDDDEDAEAIEVAIELSLLKD